MKLKKVVVDELPESCRECVFRGFGFSYHKCMILNLELYDGRWTEERPSWCPLVLEEMCKWESIGRIYDWDDGWVTTYELTQHPSVLFDIKDKDYKYIYCPNCGKEIKYVEEIK